MESLQNKIPQIKLYASYPLFFLIRQKIKYNACISCADPAIFPGESQGYLNLLRGGGGHIFINFFYNAILRNLNSQGGAEGTPPLCPSRSARAYIQNLKQFFSFDFVSFNAIVHYV